MEIISDLFRDSIMQSMILSPIMGVFFAVLFSGLTDRPTAQAPATVVQTKHVYVTHIIEHRGGNSRSDDGGAILIAFGVAILFILWKYATHVDLIHYYISVALFTAMSFGFTAIAIAYLKGQFTSEEWWIYLLSPLFILGACTYLLDVAHSTFNPKLTELALQHNIWDFYTKSLSNYGRNFMLTHVSGIVALCFAISFSFLALLHYLSLMNLRSAGTMTSLWSFLARITIFFSGKAWLVASVLLLVIAYFGIEPKAAALWLTNWQAG